MALGSMVTAFPCPASAFFMVPLPETVKVTVSVSVSSTSEEDASEASSVTVFSPLYTRSVAVTPVTVMDMGVISTSSPLMVRVTWLPSPTVTVSPLNWKA